jgi:signal transduction histidine kinase
MRWTPERKWIAGSFSLIVLLVSAISWISYQNATRLAESAKQVKRTHEVLETLIGILAILNEAEAGRRGYIFFGDRSELERFNRASQALPPKLDRLQRSASMNHGSHQKVEKLRALITQRLRLAQQSIVLYQENPLAKTSQTMLIGENTRNRQIIQQLVAEMQQEEEQALEGLVRQSQFSIQRRMLLEFLWTFLTFLVLFILYVLLYRQMVKRQQAEISQRKLAQEKELDELKLQFFSMASHEFRTPLSTILGSAQVLEENLQPFVEKQKLKSLQRIQSATRSMNKLLSDILTLARADAGKLEYHPQLVEMQSFCLNLIEDLQLSSEFECPINFSIQGDCTYVCIDERLLYSILSNLLSNAAKYSPNREEINFLLKCETNALIFQVQDQGIGIPKDTQKLLFEPFQRGDNVEKIAGTGLGLAVVKKCLDLHQGHITVESEIGRGTTFTVTIPQENGATVSRR